MKLDRESSNINEEQLCSDISQLIEVTQQRTQHEINRAKHGANVIKTPADKLQTKFGKGFG